MKKYILIPLILLPYLMYAQHSNTLIKVDDSYLLKHDIVYKTPAYEGYEGFPLGNGDLGGVIWNSKNGLEMQINKNDLFDQPNEEAGATLRNGARLSIDLGMPGFEWLFLDDFDGRLSLKNAEVSLFSVTPFATNEIKSWVSADKNVWFVQITTTETDDDTIGNKIRISLERYGSRAFPGWYGGYTKNTQIGLGNTRTKTIYSDIILEEKFKGLDFSVACRILGEKATTDLISSNRVNLVTEQKSKHNIVVMVSVVTSNEAENPTRRAIELLNEVESETLEKQKAIHKAWWSDFWGRSFVSLGNDYIENLYYLRRYLMGSSSRGKYPVVFNGGLWTWNRDVRNWVTPHHWNTQQQYWGLASQNDCELMLPYLNTYFRLMPEAEKHAAKRGAKNAILWSEPHDFFGSMTFWDRGDMLNNFTPACQIAGFFWEYYQYTQDKDFLAEKGYPFLKKAAEFYIQTLKWDKKKNEYFIYPSQPYESPRSHDLKNPISDRNMILSTMRACIKSAEILKIDNQKIKEWRHIIDHLWSIPFREEPGIGEVMQLAYNPDGTIYPSPEEYGAWTNHFSANTSLVFPANVIGMDQKGSREFNAASNVVKNHSKAMNAISPDPIVAARLGLGDVVLERMTNGIRRLQHFPQGLFYNIDHWYNLSLYMDSVKQADIATQRDYIYDSRAKYPKGHPAKPFIQCGLETLSIYSAATNEMLLQSNEGKIRVFPAVPEGWSPAFKLLARGAFIVSSKMNEDGSIPGVQIESLRGNECVFVSPWEGQSISVLTLGGHNREVNHKILKNNCIAFQSKEGQSYVIVPKGQTIDRPTLFKSNPNDAPKRFLEAELGKHKNF